MDKFKVCCGILLLSSLASGKVFFWEDKSIEVQVPRKSLVSIEVPCKIRSVFVNDLVSADYSINGVYVSVGEVPTSVGIACTSGDTHRVYSLYLYPSSGGHVFVKIVDPYLESLNKQEKPAQVKIDISTLEVIQSLRENRIPSGMSEVQFTQEITIKGIKLTPQKAIAGNGMIAIVYMAQNTGFTQKRLTKDHFSDYLALWIEKEGYLKSGETSTVIIIKKLEEKDMTIPWK